MLLGPMKIKTFIAFLLCFCIISCAPKRSEKELTLALAGETETLDPALSYDGITHGEYPPEYPQSLYWQAVYAKDAVGDDVHTLAG